MITSEESQYFSNLFGRTVMIVLNAVEELTAITLHSHSWR